MFLVKASGVLLIIVSCAAFGFFKSFCIKNRVKKISEFYHGLSMLYEYIEQGGTELFTAVENSFSKCQFLYFEKQKFHCKDNDLNQDDKAVIDDFFNTLGTSVKKVECDRINALKIVVKKRLDDAERDSLQKEKIYQMLGICTGLTVGILLI